jgi:hypothetical protein
MKGICPNNKTIIGGENFEYGTISELKKNIGQNYFFFILLTIEEVFLILNPLLLPECLYGVNACAQRVSDM